MFKVETRVYLYDHCFGNFENLNNLLTNKPINQKLIPNIKPQKS